ncbi:MAG TPA: TonB-dependent receptor [Azospira sp.]|nr:TonB-dependent receptor [Azospira sp.]
MPIKLPLARFLGISAVFFSSSLMAVEEILLSENDVLGDVPMVLTVSRLRQAVADAPAAVTVIDRQMIRDSGAWDVTDALRLVPGMYVGSSADNGVFVPNSTVSYHGMADAYSRRMQVLVDGRSIYTPLFGGPIWSTLPISLDDIERIEVIRGPNSVTYGANSFLGVINIITRHPAETLGDSASLASGTPGNDMTYRHGGRNGDLDYRVTMGYRQDRGITEVPEPTRTHPTVDPRYDNKRLGSFSFRGDYQVNSRDSLETQVGYSNGLHQAGNIDDASNSHRQNRLESHYASLNWQRSFSADEQVSVRFYTNRDAMGFDLGNPTLPAPLNEPVTMWAERYDLEAEHTLAPSATTRLVWGAGARVDRVSSLLYLGRSDAVSFRQNNLFANLEWRPHRQWVLNGGAMVENNSFTGTHVSPRFAANFHVVPGHTLRLSATRATHTPVMLEQQSSLVASLPVTQAGPLFGMSASLMPYWLPKLTKLCSGPVCRFAAYVPSDSLKSETIYSREIGYVWEFAGGSLDLKHSLDQLDDLIETYSLTVGAPYFPGTASSFRNGGKSTVRSTEAQLQWHFDQHTRIFGSWTETRISGQSLKDTPYPDSAPFHSYNLMLARDFGSSWTASLIHYHVGAVTALGDGDPVEAYSRTDLRLAKRFSVGATRGELAFVVQNLADHKYLEFLADNQIGRRSFATLRLDF